MLANIQTFANFLAPYLRYFNLPYTRVPPKLIQKMTYAPSCFLVRFGTGSYPNLCKIHLLGMTAAAGRATNRSWQLR